MQLAGVLSTSIHSSSELAAGSGLSEVLPSSQSSTLRESEGVGGGL